MENEAKPSTPLEQISEIKKGINEIAFAPLSEHGKKFEEVNAELSKALQSVEGLSN
jgi:hypothetical protein